MIYNQQSSCLKVTFFCEMKYNLAAVTSATQLYGSKDKNGCKLLLFIVIVVIYVCTCKILLHPV